MNVYYLHESCQMSSNTCCTWTTQCTCKRRKWHFGSKIVQKSKKILGLNCELIAVRLPVLRDNIKEPSPGGWQKKIFSKQEREVQRTPIALGVSILQPTPSTSPSSHPQDGIPQFLVIPHSRKSPSLHTLQSFTQQPLTPGSHGNPPKLSKRDNGWAATARTAR